MQKGIMIARQRNWREHQESADQKDRRASRNSDETVAEKPRAQTNGGPTAATGPGPKHNRRARPPPRREATRATKTRNARKKNKKGWVGGQNIQQVNR